MNRIRILASGTFITILLAGLAQACSSDDEGGTGGSSGGGSGGTVGSGGSTGGSGGSTGGTGGSTGGTDGSGGSTGGTDGSGGSTGGTDGSGGSTGGTGGGTGACPSGTSDGVACTADCTGICGLADLGTRTCTCVSNVFDCASCQFTGGEPILQPPDAAPQPCADPPAEERKGTPCTQEEQGQFCDPLTERRICACWNLEWDCDATPWPD